MTPWLEPPPDQGSSATRSIGVVLTSLSSRAGGLGVAARALARRLREAGDDVHVYGVGDAQLDAERMAWRPVPIHAAAGGWPGGFGYAPDLRRALASGGHELVHLHGLWLYASIAAAGWARRLRRPLVVSPHGMLEPWALNHSAWKKALAMTLFERRNLQGASCIHALNAAEAAAVRRLRLTAPVAVIPNGVDLPDSLGPCDRPSFLAGDDRRVLLFLGRLHPKKGVLETLAAWSDLRTQAPQITRDWTLVVAGWGERGYEEVVRGAVDALGLGGAVHVPGAVHGRERDALLRCADAFILASRSEGLPMAVLEAWAYATPVLMTGACNLPEGFEAGAAIEVSTRPPQIAAALAEHLCRGDLGAIGQRGRRLVEQRFSWRRVSEQTRDLHRWLLSGGAAPATVTTD